MADILQHEAELFEKAQNPDLDEDTDDDIDEDLADALNLTHITSEPAMMSDALQDGADEPPDDHAKRSWTIG